MREDLFDESFIRDLQHIAQERKCDVVNAFWPSLHSTPETIITANYVDFFGFIKRVLGELKGCNDEFAVRDLSGLLAIVHRMQASPQVSRDALVQELASTYHNYTHDLIIRSVELAAQLWLGVHIASKPQWSAVGLKDSHDTRVTWLGSDKLEDMVAAALKTKSNATNTGNYLLDDSFTYLKLHKLRQLKIRWTDNLVDHLKLEGGPGDRTLSVYYHKICLANHRKEKNPPIQEAILTETIRTLDLLFPMSNKKTGAFLKKEGRHFFTAVPPEQSGPINLNDFTYLRERISDLLGILNGPPETVTQMLLDTRNASQSITLWVAIFGVFLLTILFGLLATVFAVKQYNVAILSYDLSLAVACLEHPELHHYCRTEL